MEEHEAHLKDVEALKLLELKEKQFHENINLINDVCAELLCIVTVTDNILKNISLDLP